MVTASNDFNASDKAIYNRPLIIPLFSIGLTPKRRKDLSSMVKVHPDVSFIPPWRPVGQQLYSGRTRASLPPLTANHAVSK